MRIGPRSAMRWVLLSVLFASMALAARGAKRITVAQLEQTLTAERTAHKSDIDIARKINSIELSERLTESAVSRLNAQLSPGSPASLALLLLADRSAFLDPPAADLPGNPPPDAAAQQHLLESAQKFALEALPRLPNLLATRTTYSFDDSPQELVKGGYRERIGLHLVGTSKAEVTVRNDKGKQAISASGATPATGGLTSWGEFGAALLIILGDSAHGKTTWSHWEQTSSGFMAVFHYDVPKSASHYEVDTSVQEIESNGDSARWAGARARDAASISTSTRTISARPAYQGSLWIDPATGVITRLTLIAELKGNPRFERGAILVDYGSMQIADKTLIVPVRSLALSSAPVTVDATLIGNSTEWLNENVFSDFHLFASTVRILADNSTPPDSAASAPASNTQPATTLAAAASQQPAPPAGEALSAASATHVDSPIATGSSTSAQPSASPPASAPPDTPIDSAKATAAGAAAASESDASNTPRKAEPPPDKLPVLRVSTNALLVPVVVRDKKGSAVGGLLQQDFEILDDGKQQPITGFSVVESAGSVEAVANPAQPATGIVPPAPHQTRFLVFLFDDRHLNSNDLSLSQKAALRAIDEALAPNDYAAVISLMGVNSGMTQDRKALKAAVMKLTVHRAFQHDTHDCPDIDYFTADRIINWHDQMQFQLAVAKVKSCDHLQALDMPSENGIDNPITASQRLALAAASHSLALGDQDARDSISGVEAVVRALGKLDGQRILVLVSPGFLSLSPDAMNFKSHLLDQALASNVVVNTLDARGLYAGNVGASEGGNSTFNQQIGPLSQDQFTAMQESENALAEIANGTGGTFFHNNNDLASGLKSLVAPPQYLYLLQISLNGLKPVGTYHHLHVKVDRKGVEVQSRRGYFLPKEGKNGQAQRH